VCNATLSKSMSENITSYLEARSKLFTKEEPKLHYDVYYLFLFTRVGKLGRFQTSQLLDNKFSLTAMKRERETLTSEYLTYGRYHSNKYISSTQRNASALETVGEC
jgi:hypothetical protein